MVRLFAEQKEKRLNPEWIQPWGFKVLSWLPLQEDELRTEGWAHGSEDAVGSGFAGGVDEDVFEDGEDGGGGEIANLTQAAPGGLEGFVREIEGGLHGFEDLRSAGSGRCSSKCHRGIDRCR